MKIEIEIPDELVEKVVREIMDNYPESSATLMCTRYKYDAMEFTFVDDESGKTYKLDKAQLIAAFPLLFTDKWPKGCTPVPMSNDPEVWDNWLSQSDAIDNDAFVQLVCLGEVIYG